MKALFIILFLGLSNSLIGQSAADLVKGKLGAYHINFSQEKVYIHHDKPIYVLGEKIWYKVYLVNAILHTPLTLSQQVIVELIDPNNVIKYAATVLIKNGGGAGDLALGANWQPGKYLLRAYTNYQRNFKEPFFFEEELNIYDAYSSVQRETLAKRGNSETTNRIDSTGPMMSGEKLMLFPEGGDLVNGIATAVGVNAYDSNFKGKGLNGIIMNGKDEIVTRFSTHESGLGFFNLIPKTGEKYTARVIWNKKELVFALPAVIDKGYVLRQVSQNKDTITLSAQTTFVNGLNDSFIVGHIRGQLFNIIEGLSGNKTLIKIPLTNTPDGILHFTLFSATGIPVSERLIFVNRKENKSDLDVSLSQKYYGKRDKIELNITSQDLPAGTELNGSLTVSELALASPGKYASDIRSYLLLESDLRGKIPDPGFFFDDKPSSKNLLDIIMLTHGWRRFDWSSLLANPGIQVDYMPEDELSISGYVTKYGNPKKPVKSRVFLSILTENFNMQKTVTDEGGHFKFGGIEGNDTIPLLIRAEIYKEKKKTKKKKKNEIAGEGITGNSWVNIVIDSIKAPPVDWTDALLAPKVKTTVLKDYLSESRKSYRIDSAYTGMPIYQMEEIVIKAKRIDLLLENRSNVLYREPDKRLIVDSVKLPYARNIFEVIRGRFAGVTVVGAYPNYNAKMRGSNSIVGYTFATFLLDGAVVDVSLINSLPADQIAFVDVLSGLSSSAIYGTGGNGVIAVYTKTPQQMAIQKDDRSVNYNFPGYYKAKIFYSPDYGSVEESHSKPDYRTTLYWDPDISISSEKSMEVSFYASDKATVYSLRFEGLTSNGVPVVFSKEFEVR